MMRRSDSKKELVWLVLILGGDMKIEYEFFETESEARAHADKEDTDGEGSLAVYVARVHSQTDDGST